MIEGGPGRQGRGEPDRPTARRRSPSLEDGRAGFGLGPLNGRVRPRDPPLARDRIRCSRREDLAWHRRARLRRIVRAFPALRIARAALAHGRDRIDGSSGNPFRANLPQRSRGKPVADWIRFPATEGEPSTSPQVALARRTRNSVATPDGRNAPCPRLAHRARPSRATSAGHEPRTGRDRSFPAQLGPTAPGS